MSSPIREITVYSSQHNHSPNNNSELAQTGIQESSPYTLQVLQNVHGNHTVASMVCRNPQTKANRNIRHNNPVVPRRSEPGNLPQVLYNIIETTLSGHVYGSIPFTHGYDELVQSKEFEELAGYKFPPLGKPLFTTILEVKKLRFKILSSPFPSRNQRIELRRDRICSPPRGWHENEKMRRLAEFWRNIRSGVTPEELLASFIENIQTIPEICALYNTPLGTMIKDHLAASNPYLFGKSFNSVKLVEKLIENAWRLKNTRMDLSLEIQVLFLFEIMSRCLYITAFFRGHEDDGIRMLGPSLALDCWLYEMGILSSTTKSGEFDPMQDDLVRMYGLGKKELRWLQNNRNPHERREQLRTLEQYHLLKSYLGGYAVEDIREQLCFCFFEIRNVRELHGKAARTMYHITLHGAKRYLVLDNQQPALEPNLSISPIKLQLRQSRESTNRSTTSIYVDQTANLNAHRPIRLKLVDEVNSLYAVFWEANGDLKSFYPSRDGAVGERASVAAKESQTPLGFHLTPVSPAQVQQDFRSNSGKSLSSSSSSEFSLQADLLDRVLARKREFKIARIMVDRLWTEVKGNGTRITKPVHRKQEEFPNNASPPSTSNWNKLDTDEKRRLLGCLTDKHPEHPEFEALARKWLQTTVPAEKYKKTASSIQSHSNKPLPYTEARLWTDQSKPQHQSGVTGKGDATYPPPAQTAHVPKSLEQWAPDPRLLPRPSFLGQPTSYVHNTNVAPSTASASEISFSEEIYSPTPRRPLSFGKQWKGSICLYRGLHTPSAPTPVSGNPSLGQSNLSLQGAMDRVPAKSKLQNQVLSLFNSNTRDWYPRPETQKDVTRDASSSWDVQRQGGKGSLVQVDHDKVELMEGIERMSRGIERMLGLSAPATNHNV